MNDKENIKVYIRKNMYNKLRLLQRNVCQQ